MGCGWTCYCGYSVDGTTLPVAHDCPLAKRPMGIDPVDRKSIADLLQRLFEVVDASPGGTLRDMASQDFEAALQAFRKP